MKYCNHLYMAHFSKSVWFHRIAQKALAAKSAQNSISDFYMQYHARRMSGYVDLDELFKQICSPWSACMLYGEWSRVKLKSFLFPRPHGIGFSTAEEELQRAVIAEAEEQASFRKACDDWAAERAVLLARKQKQEEGIRCLKSERKKFEKRWASFIFLILWKMWKKWK